MDALFALFTPEQWGIIGAIAGVLSLVVVLLAYFLGGFGWLIRRAAPHVQPRPPWPLICPDGIRPERTVQGRNAEVRQLHIALDAQTAVAITPGAVVRGAGGLGKTMLARYYVQQYGRDYAGIWWIDAERPETLVNSLCTLAARLGVTVDAQAGREALAHQALAQIGAQADPWLLVFDNAPGPRALREWRPEAIHVHVLVTTREGDWPAEKYKLLQTGVLDYATEDSPAVALLMQESGRSGDAAGARALAEALGGLPLALVNAGAYLRDVPEVGFGTYAERLEAAIRQAPPEGGDYELSVFGAVALSLDRLSPEAQQIASILAFWAPEGLNPSLFVPVGKLSEEHEGSKQIGADLWPVLRAEGAVAQAFAELARRSLIERRGEGEEADYALHRLTGAVIRARLGAGGCAEWREAAAAVLAAAYPNGNEPRYRPAWPLCTALTPHVQVLAGHGAGSAAADYLYNQAAVWLGEMSQDLPGLALARAGLHAKKRRLDPLQRDVGTGYTTLGASWLDLGRPVMAEKLLARAAEIAEGNPEIDDVHRAVWFSNHGNALKDLGRRAQAAGRGAEAANLFSCAARRHQQALLLARRRGDRSEVANWLDNLGTLRRAQGRRAAAIRLGRMALRIRRKVQALDDPALATSLHNLARRIHESPDWRTAEPLLNKALEIREDAFAAYPRHRDRVDTATSVVLHALMRGDRTRAAEMIARYPQDLDLTKLERDALITHLNIRTEAGEASPAALNEILDLMGLTLEDARRLVPEATDLPQPAPKGPL